MIFHEDPNNTKSPTLGPRLTHEHLKDALDPTLKFTCCFLAEKSGTLDTHDCDTHHIYYVRKVVAQRYIEYVQSGADEVLWSGRGSEWGV